MRNVQISFDETLLEEVDRVSAIEKMSRSAIVREALRKWIQEKEVEKFEKDWIKSLQESPGDPDELAPWMQAESWEK
jgi:CopG family transcriptional regulator/antitoxin EndoAI